jgi:ribosomal protein S18 acetylase RimI-like enzyme
MTLSDSERPTGIPGITLRTYREDELEFLYELFATTRADEMDLLMDWTDAQKESFVRSQFQLQHDHYTRHYPGASLDVVLERGNPIGRLYVYRAPSEIRLMEVTLLPEKRNRGVGGALTRKILAEAESSGRPVVLHVEPWNPAMHLYERLDFVAKEDVSESSRRMEWWPPGMRAQGQAGES